MARSELIFRGPLVVGDSDPVAAGELWAIGSSVVAFTPDGTGRLTTAGVARSATVEFDDEWRLTVAGTSDEGAPLEFSAAVARQALGAWTGKKIVAASGSVVAEPGNVEWSTQGVTVVVPAAGATPQQRIEYPGFRTSIVGQQSWIEPWSGDPAERLAVLSTVKPCGCSGG